MHTINRLLHTGLAIGLCLAAMPPCMKGKEMRAGGVFNVRDYGAVGDGAALDTGAIDQTIKACAKAGGGTVLFPAGVYVSGTFSLQSNVTLDLETGAVLRASHNLADYGTKKDYGIFESEIGQSGEGLRVGIIVANEAENVAITGHGVIDGQGTYFVDEMVAHYGEPADFDRRYTRQGSDFLNPKMGVGDGPVRPRMGWNDRPGVLITLAHCRNVLLRDVTIEDSHNWTINIAASENVEVSGINILNNLLIPNNDGIDVKGARNARISDCNITAGDDAIAASGCENLVVTNCILVSRSSAIRFGGGRYCTFDNLVIRHSNRGIGVYGSADTVLFSNIIIQTELLNGQWWGKAEPIFIATKIKPQSEDRAPIRHLRFTNIMAEGESGIVVYGSNANAIQDLSFDRIRLKMVGGPNTLKVGGNFDLRGLGGGLDLAIFKHDIPGIYCQYVDGLQIHGFQLDWADGLPDFFSGGIHCDHCRNLMIDGFSGRQAQLSGGGSAIALQHVDKVILRNCEAAKGTDTFLLLQDVTDRRLLDSNDLSDAKQAVQGE